MYNVSMLFYICNSRLWRPKQENYCRFEASLGYILISRLPSTTVRDLVLKTTKLKPRGAASDFSMRAARAVGIRTVKY